MSKVNDLVQSASKTLQKTYHQGKFTLMKHSPEILVVGGVIGTVTAFALAIKATMSLNDVLEDGNNRIEAAKTIVEDENGNEVRSQKEINKEITKAYVVTALDVTKLYAPSVIVLGFSITAILGSHRIMQKRNLSLAAAYTALDKAFKEYKERVVDRFGEETEKEIRYGTETETVESIEEGENGKKKKVKTKESYVSDEPGPYAKFFDESSRCWEKDAELNLMFLRRTERYMNDILRRDGYLFLCDVYKALDIEETKASRSVGWLYNPDDKNLANYVDFGIYDTKRKKVRDFVNGLERVVLLDFNPDGVIINKANYPG